MRYVFLIAVAAAACGRAGGGASSSVSDAKMTVNVVVLGPGLVRGGGLSADCRGHCSFDVPAGTAVHLLSVADARAPSAVGRGRAAGTPAATWW
ncbi:MAG: hypothetical protein ACM3PC_02230 [Deltaproteobacteria bacterium]